MDTVCNLALKLVFLYLSCFLSFQNPLLCWIHISPIFFFIFFFHGAKCNSRCDPLRVFFFSLKPVNLYRDRG